MYLHTDICKYICIEECACHSKVHAPQVEKRHLIWKYHYFKDFISFRIQLSQLDFGDWRIPITITDSHRQVSSLL